VRLRLLVGLLIAAPVLLIGGLFIGGGPIPACLGLSTTVVGCAAATGVVPTPFIALPVLFVAGLVGVLALAVWPDRPNRPLVLVTALGSGLAALVGVGIYAATRPLTLEGPTFIDPFDPTITGPFVVLPLPFDGPAAVASGLLAGLVAIAVLSVAYRLAGVARTRLSIVRKRVSGSRWRRARTPLERRP
jgi:hypothetical protein